jgi:2-keto-3-deoxy-L-rhamnonate aldolase RhmA
MQDPLRAVLALDFNDIRGLANGRINLETPGQFVDYYTDAVVAIMLEKRLGFENLDDILKVPGIDMVQFGPGDYGLSIGRASATYAGGLHPDVSRARETCIKKTLDAGLRPRAEISSVGEVDYYIELGVKDFNLGTELAILQAFYRDQGKAVRDRVALASG